MTGRVIMDNKDQQPDWLDEIERLANDRLGDGSDGSACKQIHPIVERWYAQLMDSDPPGSRDAVLQAVACLSTEILLDMPEEVFEALLAENIDQLDVAYWIQEILMIGRAFQIALDRGDLDDL
jgi:hypothetical protein